MKKIFYIFYICLITIVYGNIIELFQQISLKNLLTKEFNYNMNFAIKNSANSFQKKSGTNNSNLSKNLNSAKPSEINNIYTEPPITENITFTNEFGSTNFDLTKKTTLSNELKRLETSTEKKIFYVIDLYEVNEQLLVEVLLEIPENNISKKFIFTIMNSFAEQGHIIDIRSSPTGLDTTNTICDYDKFNYCNVTLQIGNFLTNNIRIKIFKWETPDYARNVDGAYYLISIINKLESKMFTIYHNGNNSKLTLGSTDNENCEDEYFWVNYKKEYKSNLKKYFYADFEFGNETFNNRKIFMGDINDKKISVPTEFIDSILKYSAATYDFDTYILTYDCLDNNLLPIKLHFPNNNTVQLAYNGITKEADGRCSIEIEESNFPIHLGGYYFTNYCFADRLRSQFGFSKKRENDIISSNIS